MIIADLATAQAVAVADCRRIGHAVPLGVVVRRVAAVAGTKQSGDDASVYELLNVSKDVLRPVVLKMPVVVVLRLRVLITQWHLPPKYRPASLPQTGGVY